MQFKNLSMDQLSDIMAYRIIVDDISSCYNTLGLASPKIPSYNGSV